jgi:hypothetical protein
MTCNKSLCNRIRNSFTTHFETLELFVRSVDHCSQARRPMLTNFNHKGEVNHQALDNNTTTPRLDAVTHRRLILQLSSYGHRKLQIANTRKNHLVPHNMITEPSAQQLLVQVRNERSIISERFCM